MRSAWVLVIAAGLALGACGGKDTAKGPASLDAVDRSCQADADCTLTGNLACCDTSCGASTGRAVNAKAWFAVSARFRPDCQGEECHVMCQKLPDCRDEDVAICKAGRCEKTPRPTEACAKLGVTPDEYCEDASGCAVALARACCTDCAAPVVTKRVATRLAREAEARCTAEERAQCGEIQCPARAVACRDHRCVEGP